MGARKPKNIQTMSGTSKDNNDNQPSTSYVLPARTLRSSRRKPKNESFATYIYRVLKQIHPQLGMSRKGMEVMDDMMFDLFERFAIEAGKLTTHSKTVTMGRREIQSAVKLLLPTGLLQTNTLHEGHKAMVTYEASRNSQ
jgi:histone H2B